MSKHTGGMSGGGGFRHVSPGGGRRSEGVKPAGPQSGEGHRSHQSGAMHSSHQPKDRYAHQGNIGTHNPSRATEGKP